MRTDVSPPVQLFITMITQSLAVVQPLSVRLAAVCHHFHTELYGFVLDRSLPPMERRGFLDTSVSLVERIRQ